MAPPKEHDFHFRGDQTGTKNANAWMLDSPGSLDLPTGAAPVVGLAGALPLPPPPCCWVSRPTLQPCHEPRDWATSDHASYIFLISSKVPTTSLQHWTCRVPIPDTFGTPNRTFLDLGTLLLILKLLIQHTHKQPHLHTLLIGFWE